MSFRSLPLMLIAFILYNVVVLMGNGSPDNVYGLRQEIFSLPSVRGNVQWSFSWGDLLILISLFLLFIELVKATYTSAASLLDHGLSMLVFIGCLIEFLLVDQAFTSVFFTIMVITLMDVIAGYTIGIRVARRDIGFGNAEM